MGEFTEKNITMEGPERLAGRFWQGLGRAALAVTHPHPLYGGSMDNNVVEALVRAGQKAGMSTLRFNFRGAGASQGRHGGGVAEREDLLAALDYLAGQGLERLYVAGYSFGAWVAATTETGARPVRGRIWIAPPVGMMPLAAEEVPHPPDLIVCGGRDEFCPPGPLSLLLDKLEPRPELVRLGGVDHFFGAFEDELVRLASGWLVRLDRDGR